MDSVKIVVLYLRQDDPKKNTALRLAKRGLVHLVTDVREVPRGLLILNPFVREPVKPDDRDIVLRRGILVIDCSWSKSLHTFARVRRFLRGYHRRLPFLISANPSHYGKPYMLTSAEAIAATLYITGFKDLAYEVLSCFKWGLEFLKINYERLENYSKGVIEFEKNYFEYSDDNVVRMLEEYHDVD